MDLGILLLTVFLAGVYVGYKTARKNSCGCGSFEHFIESENKNRE